MRSSLLMDFIVDKENNEVRVKREFAAPLENVWSAWTEPELLDQWWAPKPYQTKTKSMDFREGGFWFYSMNGPEGDTHWCRADYSSISPKNNYKCVDAFCDPDGNPTDFPNANWDISFADNGDYTTVTIVIKHSTLEALMKYIEMGFKEGFIAALENLDELLSN